MAHYLIKIDLGDEEEWHPVEARSAEEAIETLDPENGDVFHVFTLVSPDPRTFKVETVTQTVLAKVSGGSEPGSEHNTPSEAEDDEPEADEE